MAAREQSPFRRVGRSAANLATRGAVWVGAGQVVVVEETMGSESYRRFLLDEMRGVLAVETGARTSQHVLVAVIGGVTAALLAVGGESVAAGVVAGVALVIAAVNHVMGPTVKVLLLTPVQRFHLWPVRRRKALDELLRAISDEVAALQGASTERSRAAMGSTPT